MRTVAYNDVVEAVAKMAIEACYQLPEDVTQALQKAAGAEESPVGKRVIAEILDNRDIAAKGELPLCQDTGVAVFFVKMGDEVRVDGGLLTDAINDGVRKGYADGLLRKSMVKDPLRRENTKDNTPAIIHIEQTPGDELHIGLAPKGGGSENMSICRILPPSAGVEGVKKFVIDWIDQAGGNPCPPIIVGVGIGGNFEKCAYLAKKAVFRPINEANPDPYYANLEAELLEEINALGVGPMGLGGTQTALMVHIETHPCHIASLPVAVNIQCHSARHAEVSL
ncbi:fumarate hydratase [bacterium]|nr:fumarate hydratase [bacterium]MCB9479798.1 fumarate hydratase [Deltaproteobacteria bacterium]